MGFLWREIPRPLSSQWDSLQEVWLHLQGHFQLLELQELIEQFMQMALQELEVIFLIQIVRQQVVF